MSGIPVDSLKIEGPKRHPGFQQSQCSVLLSASTILNFVDFVVLAGFFQ